jgi:uncharacterized protein (TIGR02271 family)
MTRSKSKPVTGVGGWRGVVHLPRGRSGGSQARIQLDDGREVLVPADALVQQDDGSYYLPLALEEVDRDQAAPASQAQIVIPVAEEQLFLDKRVVETGRVRVRKVVREREELVDEPLLREEVEVERVPINRLVDGPAEVRREGDTTIIPVYEEVLVVEKRLMLKEEIRVSRRKTEVHQPQHVTTRAEEVIVEREREGQESRAGLNERERG